MTLRRFALAAALLTTSLFTVVAVQAQTSAAQTSTAQTSTAQTSANQDPVPDKTNPAAMEAFQLPSHGALLNALVYVAAGVGPHPTILLLHGFPGNERNLDLAQGFRRAGYNVLFFDYRGSWGSPGDFSFTHSIEDTDAAIAYLRTPANANKLRVEPNALILIGHSMGGMIAAVIAAEHAADPYLRGTALISAANMAGRVPPGVPAAQRSLVIQGISRSLASQGMAPLAGCTPESLAQNLLDNPAWRIPELAPKLASHPVFLIASDDGNTPSAEALRDNLKKLGDTSVTFTHLPTDHSYSDHRLALQQALLDNLATLKLK